MCASMSGAPPRFTPALFDFFRYVEVCRRANPLMRFLAAALDLPW